MTSSFPVRGNPFNFAPVAFAAVPTSSAANTQEVFNPFSFNVGSIYTPNGYGQPLQQANPNSLLGGLGGDPSLFSSPFTGQRTGAETGLPDLDQLIASSYNTALFASVFTETSPDQLDVMRRSSAREDRETARWLDYAFNLPPMKDSTQNLIDSIATQMGIVK
jgi:hypothetical protein